jgi:hypothetical protein
MIGTVRIAVMANSDGRYVPLLSIMLLPVFQWPQGNQKIVNTAAFVYNRSIGRDAHEC